MFIFEGRSCPGNHLFSPDQMTQTVNGLGLGGHHCHGQATQSRLLVNYRSRKIVGSPCCLTRTRRRCYSFEETSADAASRPYGVAPDVQPKLANSIWPLGRTLSMYGRPTWGTTLDPIMQRWCSNRFFT
jgi:hypothetical protein